MTPLGWLWLVIVAALLIPLSLALKTLLRGRRLRRRKLDAALAAAFERGQGCIQGRTFQ